MKISISGKAAFIIKVILVCVIFALTAAACVYGSLAVSGAEKLGRYLPNSAESTAFSISLVAALVAVVIMLIFGKVAERITVKVDGNSVAEESKATKVSWIISRCFSIFPAAISFYVFYFAFSDESLGTWGNAVMLTAFITSLFFLFKIFKGMRAGKVISGFGVFALCAMIIASLYLDHEIELNSDFKLLVQFGAAGIILGTIADIRVVLLRIKSRWYITLKAIAFILCVISSVIMLSAPVAESGLFPVAYFVYSKLYLAYVIPTALEIISALIGEKRAIYNYI